MDVHLTPNTERRLAALAAKTGRAPEELLEDAIPYLEELAGVRDMLDTRYDDLKSGRIQPVPGDEIEAHFRGKSAEARRAPEPD
jgi:predicted transcriptional regulator